MDVGIDFSKFGWDQVVKGLKVRSFVVNRIENRFGFQSTVNWLDDSINCVICDGVISGCDEQGDTESMGEMGWWVLKFELLVVYGTGSDCEWLDIAKCLANGSLRIKVLRSIKSWKSSIFPVGQYVKPLLSNCCSAEFKVWVDKLNIFIVHTYSSLVFSIHTYIQRMPRNISISSLRLYIRYVWTRLSISNILYVKLILYLILK